MTLLDADVKFEREQELADVGEDTWELFETIEDSFGVDLGDYRSLCGLTITEIAREVSKKADYPDRERCLSAVVFYRLRRSFEKLFNTPRTAIRPATPLGNLLPWKNRRAQWKMLQEDLGLALPGLVFPGWALSLSIVCPAALLISLRAFCGFPLDIFAIFIYSILLIIPTAKALLPFARILPSGSETFGGLAKVVLARNYAAFAKQHGSSSESDVLSALQQLIATEMVRGLEEIPPYTIIPQGLNIY
jgi:hypothetical protein